MKFNDMIVFKNERFSIGQEVDSKKYYLSIPVSNGLIEYEEYYEISKEEYERLSAGVAEVRALAQACRQREADQRLIMQLGKKRGSPV